MELNEIIRIIRVTSLIDLKNLAAMNGGSYHKTKDEIVNQVCSLAQSAMEFQNLLLSCLQYVADGGSFDKFIDYELDEINRANQPQADRDARMKCLMRLAENKIEI